MFTLRYSRFSTRTSALCSLTLFVIVSYIISNTSLAFKDHTGLENSELYKIVWKGPYEESKSSKKNFNSDNVINIATKNRENYKCIVPNTAEQLNFDSSATNSSSESSLKDKTPFKLIEQIITSDKCSYKFELYWVYELCHGKFLRQYHEEGNKYKTQVGQSYYLGRLEQDNVKSLEEEIKKEKAELDSTGRTWPKKLINGIYRPYITINMTGGTVCDLTKRSRTTRVIYACNLEIAGELLYSIKEVATCEYEAIFLSSILCKHQDFKLETVTQHEIECFSIGDAPRKPTQTIEVGEDEDEDGIKDTNKRRGPAYYEGRTLIIDADLLFG